MVFGLSVLAVAGDGVGATSGATFNTTPPLPERNPKEIGLLPDRLAVADRLVAEAVQRDGVPGAVLIVGRHGAVALRKAYGSAALRPLVRPMTLDTVFDLASLTKPVATTTAAAQLLEQGRIDLDAPVARYLPAFAQAGGDKARLTIRDLMTHASGLPADGPYAGRTLTMAQIIPDIAAMPQVTPPGTAFLYSDLSYITLGAVIEAVTGETLDAYCRDHVFAPLGMKDTTYKPTGALSDRTAATTAGDETPEHRGKVHDPTAAALGGVAGHAGVFSTGDDLARFCQMMLNGGEYDGHRVLQPETVALITSKQSRFEGNDRGLGWDLDSGYSIRGALPPGSYGHTGFTGTSMWIDPSTGTFVLLLTNAVHNPGHSRVVIPLRRALSDAVAAAIVPGPAGEMTPSGTGEESFVQTGLEVLERENFKRLEGKKVGVVCNATSVDREGRHLVDLLLKNKSVNVVALFGPEHGIRGEHDETIGNSLDPTTGLKVYSLYDTRLPAEDRYRPSAEMLQGIDTLVFDIQDIGVRYYTYITTLGYVMEAAAKHKIKVIVLDRPNPLGGLRVEGPNLQPEYRSFAGYHDMPITHGMTIGELALLFNAERKIGADVEVVKMVHWDRRLLYDETGLPWVNPSPNIRNVREAALYPGIGFLEGLPLSVGRGTDTPFEVIGAPWIDGLALARDLNHRGLPAVSFVPTRFTPVSSKYRGEACGGVQILLWNRHLCPPSELGIYLADALIRRYPDHLNGETLHALRGMIGNAAIPEALAKGTPPETIIASWAGDVEEWYRRRAAYLLY